MLFSSIADFSVVAQARENQRFATIPEFYSVLKTVVFSLIGFIKMTQITTSGQTALAAHTTCGVYCVDRQDDDVFAPCYTVEVKGAAGQAFLRRLLTADVKRLPEGGVTQSFILNALGFITDFVTVAHLPGAEPFYRVVFQSIDTLAWMHQVAKAFDVEIVTVDEVTALIYGEKLPAFSGLRVGRCLWLDNGLWALQTAHGILLQGQSEALDAALDSIEATRLDWASAYTLSIVAREPHAMDWMTGDVTVDAVNGAAYVDFSDASRVFIGRALTEARIRAVGEMKTVVLKSHMDNGADFFEEPDRVVIADRAGNMVTKTDRIGLLGEALIAPIYLPKNKAIEDCLWVIGVDTEPKAYTVEAI